MQPRLYYPEARRTVRVQRRCGVGAVAIIGDVGGHADQLIRCLGTLGVGPDSWPDGLTVVQVGDLLGGGDDLAVVDMIQPFLGSRRWIQVLGNWDSRLLGGWWFTSPRGSR